MAAAVALIVAHMARKQARQIKLHRIDPSVPLVSPPHVFTRFLKGYGPLIFSVVVVSFLSYGIYEKQARASRVDVAWLISAALLVCVSLFVALARAFIR